MMRDNHSPHEKFECAVSDYTEFNDHGVIGVQDSEYDAPNWVGANSKLRFRPDNKTQYEGHLEQVSHDGLLITEYSIMDTDFDTYSMIYSCNENKLTKRKNEYVWLLTRYPVATADQYQVLMTKFTDLMDKQVPDYIIERDMHATIQGKSCPYPPSSPEVFLQ